MTPPSGAWATDEALPVFHNPITDESETDYFEGFNPDGTPAKFDFGVEEVPFPFLYVEQDEGFFYKPENRPDKEKGSGASVYQEIKTPFDHRYGMLSLMEDLVLPNALFADSGIHDECYHEGRELYLSAIQILDDHESKILGKPEIYTKCQLEHADVGGWNSQKVYFDFVDSVGFVYDGDNYIPVPVEVFNHSGQDWDFDPYWPHPEEDWARYRVKEEDLWPNGDDRVARWREVPSVPSQR